MTSQITLILISPNLDEFIQSIQSFLTAYCVLGTVGDMQQAGMVEDLTKISQGYKVRPRLQQALR